jgi:hypothetical protein
MSAAQLKRAPFKRQGDNPVSVEWQVENLLFYSSFLEGFKLRKVQYVPSYSVSFHVKACPSCLY